MNQIVTYGGKRISVLLPEVELIRLDDIAEGLSRENRFAGNTINDYNVAQHSVLVASLLEWTCCTERVVRHGLMHDASEAYLGDIPNPIKKLLPDYKMIESIWEDTIRQRFFGNEVLTDEERNLIKWADNLAFMCEASSLAKHPLLYGVSEDDVKFRCSRAVNAVAMIKEFPKTWSRSLARESFLEMAENLNIHE